MNLNSFTKNSRTIVAIAVIFFGFTLLFAMLFWEFPPEQKDIYYSVSGVVGTLLSLVVSYYFGASKTETQHESDTKKSDEDLTDD